jgi:hypothetical protein
MNLFRSEEHVRAWEAQHVGLQGEILTLERALALVTFIGKDRPQLTYTHPRATGALGPLMQSLGLTGAWWQAK